MFNFHLNSFGTSSNAVIRQLTYIDVGTTISITIFFLPVPSPILFLSSVFHRMATVIKIKVDQVAQNQEENYFQEPMS